MTILSSGPPGASSSSCLMRSMATTCRPLSWPMTPSPPPPMSRMSPSAGKSATLTSSLGWMTNCAMPGRSWAGAARTAARRAKPARTRTGGR
ncbi:MAG: hypothetical protein M0C28_13060 [Candidatus Moduliflexus flocculans]|nr:hypothetical protein [Candidatus Moduliflexus flocculans]